MLAPLTAKTVIENVVATSHTRLKDLAPLSGSKLKRLYICRHGETYANMASQIQVVSFKSLTKDDSFRFTVVIISAAATGEWH